MRHGTYNMALLKPTAGYDGSSGHEAAGRMASPRAAKLGLWLFMGVVTTLFLLLSLAYLSRSQLSDWQALAGDPGQPLSDRWRLWLNTAMLLASSIALQWSHGAARRNNRRELRLGLGLGGLFAAAFLLGQLGIWQQLVDRGYFVAANPANSFFYLLTGLHGLHLLGGLIAWGKTTAKVLHGAVTAQVHLHVELCARYWHFLFVVWLLLFALLASPRETLEGIAAICGLR